MCTTQIDSFLEEPVLVIPFALGFEIQVSGLCLLKKFGFFHVRLSASNKFY